MKKNVSPKNNNSRCDSCGLRFSILNLIINAALAILKGIVGFFSGSRALMACSLYSINDVLSAIIVMVSLKVGGRPADDGHVYGHGKAEFLAIASMSFIMVAGLLYIIFYSVADVVRGVEGPPHIIALFVAVLSMFAGEFLSRMGFCSARHLDNSPSLHTCAEHNQADAHSSLLVAVGVGGALLGLHILDPIVAIIETLHISILSGTFFGKAIKGLMDSSLPDQDVECLSQACSQVPGVARVVLLRTRQMGNKSCVDMVINVARSSTVVQAHKVALKVKSTIRETLGHSVETHVRFKSEEC